MLPHNGVRQNSPQPFPVAEQISNATNVITQQHGATHIGKIGSLIVWLLIL